MLLIVFAIIGLVGMTALAVDGGRTYAERRRAQSAADSTALASAYAKVYGGNIYTAGLARATSNNFTDTDATAGTSNTRTNIEIYNPPISGTYAGNAEYIQVFITDKVPTFFGRVIGIQQVTNKVKAVARARPPITTPLAFGNAVVGLSPHDCAALKYTGSSNVDLIGSGLFVNSDCADSAFFNNSSSPGSDLTAPCLTSVGGITSATGSLDIPSNCISTGSTAWGYPPSNIQMPDPTCGTQNASVVNVTEMTPGNWTGNFPPNKVTTLHAGVYCISGNFSWTGSDTLIGHDVVFRMNSGSVNWSGDIRLDAPDSGPYAGLLLYMPQKTDECTNPNKTTAITINGGTSASITGSILAPGANISVEGGGGTDGLHTQFVGCTVKLGGSSSLKLVYNADEQFFPPTPASIELVE